ncbi:MAG: thiamine-phosphate pyrophosphorylase [Campylobacterota bacterium]|nr:thiamine-phosphate pyrophosphorylase [Campylobacterota bacterium]
MIVSSKDFDTLKSKIAVFNPDYILFRDKEILDYSQKAFEFLDICKNFSNLKTFLHQDASLAKELGACGVHLTSKQFDGISSAKRLGLEVIISTHTHEEVLEAQRLGADAITYSPIFCSPNKGEPKGLDDLKNLLNNCNIKVFALGGIISKEHIAELEKTGVYGFASIRYFF